MRTLKYLILVFLFNNLLAAQQVSGCISNGCHSGLVSKKNVHPVASDDCSNCHDGEINNHPQGQGSEFTLLETSPSLCYNCHDNLTVNENTKSIHPPFEEDCLNCHNPHSSENNYLLEEEVLNLCFQCHDDPNELENVTSIHGVINSGKKCINCHSPHSSTNSRLLLQEEMDLCLSCHNRELEIDDKKITNIAEKIKNEEEAHPSVIDGCSDCHNPHSSGYTYLLNDKFPKGNYAAGFEGNYNLCFSCHDETAITEKETTTSTYFRDGMINLHFLHVNQEKSRSCINCHDVHGSKIKHLINENTGFGNWKMKNNYSKTETGGSCLPGCHSEKKYNR